MIFHRWMLACHFIFRAQVKALVYGVWRTRALVYVGWCVMVRRNPLNFRPRSTDHPPPVAFSSRVFCCKDVFHAAVAVREPSGAPSCYSEVDQSSHGAIANTACDAEKEDMFLIRCASCKMELHVHQVGL